MRDMVKHVWNYALLVVLVLLAACSEKNEYTRVIPQDASVVGSFQVSSLVQKSGLTESVDKATLDKMKKNVTQGLAAEEAKVLEDILNNPSESGIDFKRPIYFFIQPDGETSGVVACVQNSDKLHDLVDVLAGQQMCAQLEEKDGASWTESGKLVLAFTDEALLMGSGRMKSEELKAQMKGWLNNPKERSFAATDEYKSMSEANADMAFVNGLCPKEPN